MVQPTGTKPRIVVDQYSMGVSVYYDDRTRRYQKAPYNLTLDFEHNGGTLKQNPPPGTAYYGTAYYAANTIYNAEIDLSILTELANKSYERVKGDTYASASLGVDFVEYRQSVNMVTKAGTTIWQAARQVRSFNFVGAAQTLRMHFVPKGVSKRKSFANNWLEYHFGWEPLMNDIHESLEVMNNPIKKFTASKGTAKMRKQRRIAENLGAISRRGFLTQDYSVTQGCSVKALQNPLLHSLDQMGVLNPLSLAWETVPFSFVVDWFVNVGQVLSSFSDFAGMTLEKPYTSKMYRVQTGGTHFLNPGYSADPNVPFLTWNAQGFTFTRVAALTTPELNVKSLRLPSKERALTAISLVIQQLKR
jgi:hypothetical protein